MRGGATAGLRPFRGLGVALILLALVAPAGAQDGVTLFLQPTVTADEVLLSWSGGSPTYRLFRSEVPLTVLDHEIGSSSSQMWLDRPPAAPVQYYQVVSCNVDPPERCDGIDNDCDGVVDGPGSEESCGLPNATAACIGGVCEIAACDSGYHDLDGSPATGCECPSDVDEPAPFVAGVLNSGRYLGAFDDCDFVQTLLRNLVPSGDYEDFYRFHIASNLLCDFNLQAIMAVPAGADYDLYLHKWIGGSWSVLRSSTSAGGASEQVSCGGCDFLCSGCGCNGCSSDGDYGVRVTRVGTAVVCEPYSLSIQED